MQIARIVFVHSMIVDLRFGMPLVVYPPPVLNNREVLINATYVYLPTLSETCVCRVEIKPCYDLSLTDVVGKWCHYMHDTKVVVENGPQNLEFPS